MFKYIPFGIFIEIISIMFRLRDLEPHHLTAGVFSLNENGNYFQKHTYRAKKYIYFLYSMMIKTVKISKAPATKNKSILM